jgi:hypothetical protein
MSDKELRLIARELRLANLLKVMRLLYPETRPNEEEIASNLQKATSFIKKNAATFGALE